MRFEKYRNVYLIPHITIFRFREHGRERKPARGKSIELRLLLYSFSHPRRGSASLVFPQHFFALTYLFIFAHTAEKISVIQFGERRLNFCCRCDLLTLPRWDFRIGDFSFRSTLDEIEKLNFFCFYLSTDFEWNREQRYNDYSDLQAAERQLKETQGERHNHNHQQHTNCPASHDAHLRCLRSHHHNTQRRPATCWWVDKHKARAIRRITDEQHAIAKLSRYHRARDSRLGKDL